MSYNISQWKVKKFHNFRIPLILLHWEGENQERHFRAKEQRGNIENGKQHITVDVCGFGDCEGISGWLCDDGMIDVESIDIANEGSGTTYRELLLDAFKQSTGLCEVVIIWEEGDSLERVTIEDGIVTQEEIEL